MVEIVKTDLEAQNGAPSGSGQEVKDAPEILPPTAEVEGGEHLSDTHKVSTDGLDSNSHASGAEEYDERAAKFWSVYVDEVEHHDEALIGTWKDDMEGVIVFAGLYSASLTAFLVESYKNLAPDPVQVNVYYTQQSVVLLAQISAQLAASGSPVPSNLNIPPPYPEFHARKSDIRINIYWFMSLAFSLTAALAATLVQQWVREYMHVFQRYNHPLKRARIRQFLYEGAKRWHMAVVIDTIPALIHISLFLFFLGLADFLFGLDTATATATTIITATCAILYFWSVIAPSLDANSPYQSPLSGAFWRLFQKFRGRTHRDRSTGGEQKLVSMDMTEGRAQIAMDESGDRKKRDASAICWVIDNLTEDSELDLFVPGIPGLLSPGWGDKVWETVAKGESNGNAIVHSADQSELLALVPLNSGHPIDQQVATTTIPSRQEDTLHELGTGITRLFKTCTDPGILPTEEARRKRARACVDAALSLVLSTEHKWEWFAESETIAQTLIYLGNVEKIREISAGGFQSPFAAPWTCMSIITVRKMLQTSAVHDAAHHVITRLSGARGAGVDHADDEAIKTAGIIDHYLKTSWESARTLHRELVREVETDMEERCREIMRRGDDDIAILEDTWNRFGWAEEIDEAIISLVRTMIYASDGVLEYLPDVVSPWQSDPRRVPDKGTRAVPQYLMPQFIPPRLFTQRLWLCVWTLRNISASGLVAGIYQPKSLGELSAPELQAPKICDLMDNQAPITTQLWRLQDLRDGGLAYMLELFIAAVKSSKSASHPLSHPLYLGTFRNITSDWMERRHATWTQRLLVDLLRRVLPANDSPTNVVPGYIIDEFLILLGKVLAEEKGPHVTEAISLIKAYDDRRGGKQVVAQSVLLTISPPKPSKPPRPPMHHQAVTV